jgi:simple sugar transport system permease protein
MLGNSAVASFSSSILAIVVGLIFGLLILLFSNPSQAFQGFGTILLGGLQDGLAGMGNVIYFAVPIIMTGLSVGFAFKTGLFNIGASGQFTVGTFVAIYIGVNWTWLPGYSHWIVALFAAALAGALWGFVPGILKAVANVNEVISSIIMNYIGMYLTNMLIVKTVFDQLKNQTLPVAASAQIPKWGIDKIFPYRSVNGAILIVIFVVFIMYIVINKTTFGFELKACGKNPNASKYAGINAKKNIVLSMVIAGAISGLGGALFYLSGAGKYMQVQDIIAIEGFNGIPVALLGLSNPIGILFAGLFIGYITVGGFNLQSFDFAPQVIDIIIAAIIYFSAFALVFKNLLGRVGKKLAKREDEKDE